MRLRVMTYNIWGGQNYEEYLLGVPAEACSRDVSRVATVIKESSADIVSLNEIFNCEAYGNQVEQIARLAGFEYYHFAPALLRTYVGGYYGNAILSKYPIVKMSEKKIPAEEGVRLSEQRGVFCATIDCNGKLIDVIISHFGLVPEEKVRAVDAVLDFKSNSDNKCIFMGDTNSVRESEHIEKLCKAFYITNNATGEITTWPVEYVPPERQTFSSPLWNRQIDFILAGDEISVNKTEAIHSLASDHKALFSDIEI